MKFGWLALALLGCHREAPRTEPAPLPLASVGPPVAAPEASVPSRGPLGAAASRSEREAAVLDLMLGGEAFTLPEQAADDGRTLDPGLRDRMAPRTTPPGMKQTKLEVSDAEALPPEVVRRIARQTYGRIRHCYEEAVKTQPGLRGELVVAFGISPDGTVADTKDGGSSLAPGLVSCAVRTFGNLDFPTHERGIIRVVYGLAFTPPT